jgi:hypothetical protein
MVVDVMFNSVPGGEAVGCLRLSMRPSISAVAKPGLASFLDRHRFQENGGRHSYCCGSGVNSLGDLRDDEGKRAVQEQRS